MSAQHTSIDEVAAIAQAQHQAYSEAWKAGYAVGFKDATEQALAILTKHFPGVPKV